MTFTLDIGGEGRHERAWNLNPSPVKTLNPNRGERITRRIPVRAEAIPLPDHSVDNTIVERSPLRKASLYEMARVIHRNGTIVLRHAKPSNHDPHRLARAILSGRVTQRHFRIGGQVVQETCFQLGKAVYLMTASRLARPAHGTTAASGRDKCQSPQPPNFGAGRPCTPSP